MNNKKWWENINVFIVVVILLLVCLVVGCITDDTSKENEDISSSHFTIEEVKSKLPVNYPEGWYLDSIEERDIGMWGHAVSKSNKTIVIIYKNSKINVTTTFRDTGETFTYLKSVELYFFPDIWTKEEIEYYKWKLSNGIVATRSVEYPNYLKQTSDLRIMYLGKDKEFVKYLNESIN